MAVEHCGSNPSEPRVGLESLPDAVVLTDSDGVVKYINQRFLRTTGFTAADVVGEALTAFWQAPHDDLAAILTRLDAQGVWRGVIQHRKKDGTQFQEFGSISKIPSADGNKFQLLKVGRSFEPSTAEQDPEAPKEKTESYWNTTGEDEKAYLSILNAAPYSITLSRIEDGRYVFVNKAFSKRTGYSPQEALERTADDLNLFVSEAERENLIQELRSQNRADGLEMRFRRKNGLISHGLISARIIRYKGELCLLYIASNIDKLKATQQALMESEKNYRTILQSAPNTISITRFADGTYMEVNDAFCQRTGYSREEIIGRTYRELNIFPDKAAMKRYLKTLLDHGRLDSIEMKFQSKQGELLETLLSVRHIEYQGEDCLLTITSNIDDLKATQRALEENEESYRTVLQTAPYSITISHVENARYVEVNDAFTQLTGYSRDEALGRTHRDLKLFKDDDNMKRFIKAFLKKGRVDNMELAFQAKDGRVRESLVSSRPIRYKGQDCLLFISFNIDKLKAAQRALQESEASYRTILEASPYSISISRLADARFVEVNDAYCQRSGYTRDETIGRTYREMEHFKDADDRRNFLKTYLKNGRVDNMELTFHTKDGREMTNLVSARTIRYKGEDCLLYISTNIDELKAVQRALIEREETYRTILDTAPYPITINESVTGKYLQVNKAHTLRTGRSPEEMLGRTATQIDHFVHPSDHVRLMKILQRDGRVGSMDMPFRAKDGRILETLISMAPIRFDGKDCIISMTVDIDELKEAQRALQESEARFRTIFETAADPIFLNDAATGRFMNVNHAACSHLGYDKADFLNMTLKDINDPEGVDPLAYFSADDHEKNGYFFESLHLRKDGSKAIVEVSSQLMTHQGRKVLLSIARDVTERKQAERELARYRENLENMVAERTRELKTTQGELVKREKLAVLGQLTATVSHELRNPLGVMRTSNFFLQRKIKPQDVKIEKHFKRIDEQITHCDAIVGDLLEYTRGRAVEVVRQDIGHWLKWVAETQQEQEDVDIHLNIAPNLPPISYDQEKLRRVVVNLLANAVQAVNAVAEKSGKQNRTYHPEVGLEAALDQDRLRIIVHDNGIGMDQETLDRAFEPLFTTRARGTGIGLAIVKKIIEEHGGHIALESWPGHGTRIILDFPISA